MPCVAGHGVQTRARVRGLLDAAMDPGQGGLFDRGADVACSQGPRVPGPRRLIPLGPWPSSVFAWHEPSPIGRARFAA